MPTIKSNYTRQLRTQAKHVQSGQTIITDAPVDNHGKGEAFSPTDLVCASLNSCMMTVMGIEAQKHEMDLEGLQSEVTKIMQSNPRKIAEIHVDFKWSNPKGSETFREKLKQIAVTCPVALSLDPDIKQIVTFDF